MIYIIHKTKNDSDCWNCSTLRKQWHCRLLLGTRPQKGRERTAATPLIFPNEAMYTKSFKLKIQGPLNFGILMESYQTPDLLTQTFVSSLTNSPAESKGKQTSGWTWMVYYQLQTTKYHIPVWLVTLLPLYHAWIW